MCLRFRRLYDGGGGAAVAAALSVALSVAIQPVGGIVGRTVGRGMKETGGARGGLLFVVVIILIVVTFIVRVSLPFFSLNTCSITHSFCFSKIKQQQSFGILDTSLSQVWANYDLEAIHCLYSY